MSKHPNEQIKLSDHFTYGRILKFTMPSIAMMVFTSIYGMVDGFFVSNFVGKTPFAAVNFIYPFVMALGAVGFLFGAGGSALVSRTMGARDLVKANRIFSLLIYLCAVVGIAISVLGIIFIRPVAAAVGAEEQLLEDAVLYGRWLLAGLPGFILQMAFQSFCVTAEKPKLGLTMTLAAGITNIVLDAVLVIPFGLVGAALATSISQMVGGVIPLIYFACPNSSLLHLGKTAWDGKAVLKTFTNGSSELLSNMSMSLVNMLYNIQLLKYAGENGVAAYGTMMYVNLIFLSIFIGYSIGTAPVVGFHLGAENHGELKSLLKKSMVIIGISSAAMLALGNMAARPLSVLYVGYDPELLELTTHGFYIFAVSFPVAGYAIFYSGFFTALNDGLTSAVISFLRTLVFQIAAVMLLPLVLGVDGIWWSITVAEAMAVLVGTVFLFVHRKKYRYL